MKKDLPDIEKLLEMRGERVPADEYFEVFLSDFHRRQREDLLKRSARSLLVERLGVWFREMGRVKWIYAAVVVCFLAASASFIWPGGRTSAEVLEHGPVKGFEEGNAPVNTLPPGGEVPAP